MLTLSSTPTDHALAEWAARSTVTQHAEGPDDSRRTGVCAHCGEADPCPCLVAAIHYLRRAGGVA